MTMVRGNNFRRGRRKTKRNQIPTPDSAETDQEASGDFPSGGISAPAEGSYTPYIRVAAKGRRKQGMGEFLYFGIFRKGGERRPSVFVVVTRFGCTGRGGSSIMRVFVQLLANAFISFNAPTVLVRAWLRR